MIDTTFSLLDFENYFLILVRITAFVAVAPFFSMSNTPARLRVGFSAIFALLMYETLTPQPLDYEDIIGYGVVVVKEGITGLLIGYAANICNSIVLVTGNIVDMNIGLSMAQEYDPINHTQTAITGTFYNYLVMLLLIITDMHHYILRAVVDSYQLIPINHQIFRWDNLMISMVQFMTDSMVIGFRIALPVFACIMVLNCVLGVMSKVAPQMNMFAVGMQMKVLVGFLVTWLALQLLPAATDFIFQEMKRMIVSMIQGMY